MKNIEYVLIKKLKLLEKNPRKITKEQMEKLCKSLTDDKEFFDLRPCLVNGRDGILEVYAGNQRVRAAKKLGWSEVPCIIEENIPVDIVTERIIKDNKTYGEFDFDILANEFDVDVLLAAGFSAKDLQISVDGLADDELEAESDHTQKCPECGRKVKNIS